jgi:hypothetical protein
MGTPSLLHFQLCIQYLSFVSNSKLIKHKYWLILCHKHVDKKSRMQNVRINPKVCYIYTHYYWCYFQIHGFYWIKVRNRKKLSNNNVGMLNHIITHYGCYELQKIATYIWIHYYGLMILQISTHSYNHYAMIIFF